MWQQIASTKYVTDAFSPESSVLVSMCERSTFNFEPHTFLSMCTYVRFFFSPSAAAIRHSSNMLQIQMKINRLSICSSTKRIVRLWIHLRPGWIEIERIHQQNPSVAYDTLWLAFACVCAYVCAMAWLKCCRSHEINIYLTSNISHDDL